MNKLDERYLEVNAHGVLRIPLELWLALFFLCRHWVLALLVTVSARKVNDTALLLGKDFTWQVLAMEVPALLLLALCAQRRPKAGRFVRALWPFAKWLAVLTIGCHIGYTVWYLSVSNYWLPWPELFLGSCALIDISIGIAVMRPGYLSQVFSEFPATKPQKVDT